ncbi:carbohydrate esterase family 4 protein [Laccaria amethystina LaAM-08-1]|uniref:chitin deacetylase n=1 Tax=Laccaria amethystina LaAM-08-1 TaxID=1095629 RepID=A0A0C9XHM8_9AGAR|nr:carbohydrate esterase family 4 protein [Laccaria amethystina LaAM-08-1]
MATSPTLFSLLQKLCTVIALGSLFQLGVKALIVRRDVDHLHRRTGGDCVPYYYAPVSTALSSFPPIWVPASILPNDTNAMDKWAAISPNVPTNIQPKGTITGNFTNVTYNATDTDCWWTYHQCVTPKLAGLPMDIASVPEPKTLGYGFDDGPNCSHNAFYDYLTSQQQKATMYYIGSNVLDWPLEAQRAITDGHEVCVHTWSHRYMTAFSSPDAFAELYYTIKLVTGVTPTCWRPPFGDVDDRIRSIANGLGLRTILWKYDSFDWKVGMAGVTEATVDQNYQSLLDGANNGTFDTVGAVMLTHELNNYTMSEAIKWYPSLRAAFKYLVPVGVAFNKTQPYVESTPTQPSFSQYIANTGPAPSVGPVAIATDPATSSEGPAPTINAAQGAKSSSASRIQISGSTAIFVVAFIGALIGQ